MYRGRPGEFRPGSGNWPSSLAFPDEGDIVEARELYQQERVRVIVQCLSKSPRRKAGEQDSGEIMYLVKMNEMFTEVSLRQLEPTPEFKIAYDMRVRHAIREFQGHCPVFGDQLVHKDHGLVTLLSMRNVGQPRRGRAGNKDDRHWGGGRFVVKAKIPFLIGHTEHGAIRALKAEEVLCDIRALKPLDR